MIIFNEAVKGLNSLYEHRFMYLKQYHNFFGTCAWVGSVDRINKADSKSEVSKLSAEDITSCIETL